MTTASIAIIGALTLSVAGMASATPTVLPTDNPVSATVQPATETPEPAPTAAVTPTGPDSDRAADPIAAAAIARKYNHPVADDSQTTDTSQVSVEPNGSFSLESSTLPVRVKTDAGWVPIDSSLTYGPDKMLTPVAAASPVQFSEGGTDLLAKVEVTPGAWLTEKWPYGALPIPTVTDNDALYSNVLPGVDLRLSSTPAGMAEVLVVKTPDAAANPKLDQVKLSLEGATVTPSAGNTLSATPNGAQPQTASAAADNSDTVSSAPVWWDSNVKDSGPDGPVGAEEAHPVSQAATGSDVTLNVGAVIDTQKITYPLYVDPDWGTGAQAYWFTDRAFPDTVYLNGNANSGGIQAVGYGGPSPVNYLSHAFWQFDTTPLSGKHILAAAFNTAVYWSNVCTSTAIQAWQYGNGADAPGFTWNGEPNAWDALLDTQSTNDGSSCAAPGNVGFNALPTAISAASGGWPNVQLGLRAANESDPGTRKHFGTAASLTVTYNSYPNKPTNLTVSAPPRQCGTESAPAYVNGNQAISLQVNATDPDSQNLGVAFYIKNLDTNSNALAPYGMPYLGTPSQAQGIQTAQMGPGTLGEGRYSWWTQSTDYIDWGGTSDTCYLTIDDTAPAPPHISSVSAGPYTVGQPMTVQFTSNDHIATFAYWWTNDTSTATTPPLPALGNAPTCTRAPVGGVRFACADSSSTSPLITVAPRADTSTLWVATFDLAGNASTSSAGQTILANADTAVSASNPNAGNVVAAKGHQWPMNTATPIVGAVADKNTTTGTSLFAQKVLKIGAGTNVTSTDHIVMTGLARHVMTLPGYLELARYYNGVDDAAFSDGFAPAGYTFEVALGQYVPLAASAAAVTGMQEFYSCPLSTGDMTSTSSTCEGTGVTGVSMGYFWPTSAAVPAGVPALPLYRCSIASNGHHFDALMLAAWDSVPASCWAIWLA